MSRADDDADSNNPLVVGGRLISINTIEWSLFLTNRYLHSFPSSSSQSMSTNKLDNYYYI